MNVSNNPYWNKTGEIIQLKKGIELNDHQFELAFMIGEWGKKHPLRAKPSVYVKIFDKIESNGRLRAFMLGVAPKYNYMQKSGNLLLHNLIRTIEPHKRYVSDEGCQIIYDHCSRLLYDIPIMDYSPNRNDVHKAVMELRYFRDAGKAMTQLFESMQLGVIDARLICKWAASHPEEARAIPELTHFFAVCALESHVTTADDVDLCYELADEMEDWQWRH